MGRIDVGEKRPVTRRSRLLVVRCARCGVSSNRAFAHNIRCVILLWYVPLRYNSDGCNTYWTTGICTSNRRRAVVHGNQSR